MKTSMPLVFVVALAVVGGLFSATIFGLIDFKPNAQTSPTAVGLITGHVITTHQDAAGNVLSYRQSDNVIVDGGENCVSKQLFANRTDGTTVCTGTRQNGYRFIAIGNNTGALALAGSNTRLGNELNVSSYGSNVVSGLTLLRQPATVSGASGWTNSSTGTNAQASVVMSAVFKNTNTAGTGNSVIVTESGLYNNTYTTVTTAGFQNLMNQDGLFARQTFSGITMSPADTLTVQWTMSVGGTTTFN
jgi:hypothetical protein